MAIKGKRKGRARARTVASAPRPFLVPPRTPPLRRRPVQVLLVLIVLGGFVALGAGLRAAKDADDRRDDVQQFSSQLDAAFATSGIVQPIGVTPLVLPELQAAVAQLEKPRVDQPGRIREQAAGWARRASQLAERIGGIEAESAGLKEGREMMEQSLQLYASIAREISVATTLDAASRRSLLEPLREQIELARTFFDFGWGDVTRERQLAGIPVVNQPIGPPLPQP